MRTFRTITAALSTAAAAYAAAETVAPGAVDRRLERVHMAGRRYLQRRRARR